jgi:drug/metabolite transporter (DMT)-like permease
MTPTFHAPLRGIAFALTAFTLWVFVDALMKTAAEAHLPPHIIIAIMGLCAALGMAAKARLTSGFALLRPRKRGPQIIAGFLSLGCNYANVIALKHLPLTIFYVSVFTAPMMIALLARLFLKESLSFVKTWAILVGFAGVVIAINPLGTRGNEAMNTGDAIGYAAAFTSALLFSCVAIYARLMTQSETIESIGFVNGIVQLSVGLALSLFLDNGSLPTGWEIGLLFATGFVNIAGNFFYALGTRYAPSATMAPFHYSQILSGALLAFIFWGEVPAFLFWFGVVLIVAAGLALAWRAKTEEKPLVPAETII